MEKEKFVKVDIDPTVSGTYHLMNMMRYNGCSVQVTWSGLTAASAIDVDIQIQQSNDTVDTAFKDDIAPFYHKITDASESITFEHNAFEAAELYIKVTSNDCTGGMISVYNTRRVHG